MVSLLKSQVWNSARDLIAIEREALELDCTRQVRRERASQWRLAGINLVGQIDVSQPADAEDGARGDGAGQPAAV
jgi:hypothetical protein